MKKILIYLLCVFPILSYADEIDDIGKIVIGVDVPESASSETLVIKDYLSNKIEHWLSQGGYSANGLASFYLSPEVTIDDVAVAEGGMKNVYVVSGTLYLKVTQEKDGVVFSSIAIPFRESNTKKEAAIKSGISKIQSAKLSPMLDEAREKIVKYYESEKNNIFAEAERLTRQGEYDAAIGVLMTIPSCLTATYQEALGRADKVLDDKVCAYNDSILSVAHSLANLHKPIETLDALIGYRNSPKEAQNVEYYQLLNKAEAMVSTEEAEAAREKRQRYIDAKIRQERQWAYAEREQAHRINMDNQQMAYNRAELASRERITNKKIESNERLTSQKMTHEARIASQNISSNERLASQRIASNERTTTQRVRTAERLMSQSISASERIANKRITAIKDIAANYYKKVRNKTIIVNHNY